MLSQKEMGQSLLHPITQDRFLIKLRPYAEKPFYSLEAQMVMEEVIREENLQKIFEVDKEHIVAYTLSALAKEQLIETKKAEKCDQKISD